MLPRVPLPPSPALVALIALAFVVPGLAGHDLWKPFDAISIGVVHEMAASGDWLVPRIAGAAWLHDPPLYHWTALAFAAAFGWALEFHSAARLASGAFVLAALALLYHATRGWTDPDERPAAAASAPLLLLGSIGLMVRAHEALPELAALAAACGALAALPHAARKPQAAGFAFGAALGLALLSAGPAMPLAIAAAVLIGHGLCPEWRTRKVLVFLASAIPVSVLVAAIWPLALTIHSRELFTAWWSQLTQPQGGLGANLRYFLAAGSWFAWPAWPLALWAAWTLRRRWREPRLFVPACAALLGFFLAAWFGPAQDVNLTAILPVLALLAAQGVGSLRRGAAAALDWFGITTFAFFAGLVWLGYVAMMTGVPPRVANNFIKTAPGFVPHFEILPLLIGLLFTVGWLYLVIFTAPSAMRCVTRWAAGVVLLWGSFAALWLPWIDYQKSYRAVALQLRSKIPVGAPCIAQRALGAPQAAALDYHAGIRPQRFDPLAPEDCPLLLVQGSPRHEFDAPGARWAKLADIGRPGDKLERYRLYRLKR